MIFEIIEDLSLLILSIYLVYKICRFGYDIVMELLGKVKYRNWMFIKGILCVKATTLLTASFYIVLMVNTYQLATIFKEAGGLEPWIESLAFACQNIFFSLIGIVIISYLWKNVYERKLIPGTGTVKQRVVAIFNNFKSQFKDKKVTESNVQ